MANLGGRFRFLQFGAKLFASRKKLQKPASPNSVSIGNGLLDQIINQ